MECLNHSLDLPISVCNDPLRCQIKKDLGPLTLQEEAMMYGTEVAATCKIEGNPARKERKELLDDDRSGVERNLVYESSKW